MATATPFNLSLVSALMMLLPPITPSKGAGVSVAAVIGVGAETTTVAVAVAQLVGLPVSQIL